MKFDIAGLLDPNVLDMRTLALFKIYNGLSKNLFHTIFRQITGEHDADNLAFFVL